MWQRFPYHQFVIGALIPLGLFYLCQRLGQPLTGILLAGLWGLGVVSLAYWRARRINVFAGLTAALTVVELAVIAITRSPSWYLASAAIESALVGSVLLLSLLLPRSLIQLLAEEMVGRDTFALNLRQSPHYSRAWRLLTAIWGGVYLVKASLLLPAQWALPLEAFLGLRMLLGLPLLASLLAFSFWFPRWYWKRWLVPSGGRTRPKERGALRLVLCNEFGILILSYTVFIVVLLQPLETPRDITRAFLYIGLCFFLLDTALRLWLYRFSPSPRDPILFFLSDTGGGQLLCLPLWLWAGVVITATLEQRSFFLPFVITLGFADVWYRLRSAHLAQRSLRSALISAPGAVVPLWLWVSLLAIFSP